MILGKQPCKLRSLLLLIGLLFPANGFSLAQQQSSEAREAELEEPKVVPIPPGEILTQIEETQIFINRSRQMAQAGFPAEEIESRVAELRKRYEQLKIRTERRLEGLLPPNLIVDLLGVWEAETAAAKSAQEIPARRARALAELGQEVRSRIERWELTRRESAEAELPGPALSEISRTIQSLKTLVGELQSQWLEVIKAQDAYSQLLLSYDQMIGLIEERAKETRSRLLSLDSPPLWSAIRSEEERPPALEEVYETWRTSFAATVDYLRNYPDRLVLQVVIFLILLLVMLAVRRRAREWGESAGPGLASKVLERPYSQALLIALLASILIHPLAPRAFATMLSFLALFPLIRLVPGMVQPVYRPVVYLLVLLFFFEQLSQLTLSGSFIYRGLLAFSTVLGMGISIFFLSCLRRGKGSEKTLNRVVRGLLKLAVWIFITSLILNLVGAALLANLLTSGLLISGYVALVFLIAIVVIEGTLQVLVRTPLAQKLHIFREHSDVVLHKVLLGFRLVGFFLWFWFTLGGFWLQGPVSDAVYTALTASVKVGEIDLSLGFVLSFAFVVWLAFLISRFVRFLLEEDVYPRVTLPRGVPGAISTITQYVILFVGVLFAFGAAGFDLSRFTLLAGAFGVGIGFGLQNVVNNFVSGLILLFERPIQVGDKVQMGELFGEVRHIGIRASVIRTWEGSEVVVPNGNLISNEVINWTLSDQIRRVDVEVGVAYGTDPERVIQLLVGVAENQPDVLEDPVPAALFLGFGDSSLNFTLRAWTRFEQSVKVRSLLAVEVNRALAKAEIEIPFPQRDLHVRSVDSDVMNAVSPERASRPSGRRKDTEK